MAHNYKFIGKAFATTAQTSVLTAASGETLIIKSINYKKSKFFFRNIFFLTWDFFFFSHFPDFAEKTVALSSESQKSRSYYTTDFFFFRKSSKSGQNPQNEFSNKKNMFLRKIKFFEIFFFFSYFLRFRPRHFWLFFQIVSP